MRNDDDLKKIFMKSKESFSKNWNDEQTLWNQITQKKEKKTIMFSQVSYFASAALIVVFIATGVFIRDFYKEQSTDIELLVQNESALEDFVALYDDDTYDQESVSESMFESDEDTQELF